MGLNIIKSKCQVLTIDPKTLWDLLPVSLLKSLQTTALLA